MHKSEDEDFLLSVRRPLGERSWQFWPREVQWWLLTHRTTEEKVGTRKCSLLLPPRGFSKRVSLLSCSSQFQRPCSTKPLATLTRTAQRGFIFPKKGILKESAARGRRNCHLETPVSFPLEGTSHRFRCRPETLGGHQMGELHPTSISLPLPWVVHQDEKKSPPCSCSPASPSPWGPIGAIC